MDSPEQPIVRAPKTRQRARRPSKLPFSVPAYPRPSDKEVEKMYAEMFTGHFFDEYLAALLARASAAVSAEFNEDITRAGLPVLHWRVLATLHDVDNMAMSHIAELTLIPLPSLTRLIQRLVTSGDVLTTKAPGDRRTTWVCITEEGRDKVSGLLAMAKERQRTFLEGDLHAEALKKSLQHLIAFCAARRRRPTIIT